MPRAASVSSAGTIRHAEPDAPTTVRQRNVDDDGAALRSLRSDQQFVEPEGAAVTEPAPGLRKYYRGHRLSDTSPDAFADEQAGSGRPTPRESKRGHAQHVDRVAGPDVDPVASGPIRDGAADRADEVTGELAASRNGPHHRAVGAKVPQEGAGYATRALVRHIREEVDDTDGDDESQSGAQLVLVQALRLAPA